MPEGAWQFDQQVADCFPDMLARSIPDYTRMRELVTQVGRRFVRKATDVVDLGCSRGDGIDPFWREFGCRNRYVLLDCSGPMLGHVRERYRTAIENGLVLVKEHDLCEPLPPLKASLTLCVLTLQFVAIEHRQRLLREVFKATAPGGALVMVEKVLGEDADSDALLVDLHHEYKRAHGYSAEAVALKRKSLRKEMAPVTATWNEDLLRSAGFRVIECIWRSLNFAGWVAIRD